MVSSLGVLKTRGATGFRIVLASLALFGCASSTSTSDRASAIAEVAARDNRFPTYPHANTTYLSFSQAHGFQVNFLSTNGKAWLWYPGNRIGVPEEYKTDIVAGQEAICWRHPSGSYNPVTKTRGGDFVCQSLALTQRTIVASLPGDPFKLRTGQIPFVLDRCSAPIEFSFDRTAFSC